ncbi:MAG TPA: hypothetical protein VNA69_11735 [Thermoanaerobaculia bacterium]|nr:hypothetical protein [Thermoanaerobaculia bacterium]
MARQHAAAAIVFAILAILMTWPLLPNLTRAGADPGDAYFTAWILDWDWWATFHRPLSLFHANVMHPAKYSLAFSEHLYGLAMLLFPLRAIGIGPLAAQNIALLAGFAFCGFAAYLLGWKLTGSFAAGMAAGVFYAFVPFRFTHIVHLQHIWGGWLPLLLLALLWYAEQPSPRRAAVFGAVFAMNGLTNMHYFLFGSFAVIATAAAIVPRRAWRDLALAMIAAMIVLAPFLYPYAAVAKLYGMERTYNESHGFSALPIDWLQNRAGHPERWLYPGTLPLIVAAFAFVAWRRAWPKIALGLAWIAIGFAGSLGMNFELHRFLFGAVPGFRAIRVPARWAVIAYIGLAILIAIATALIARRNKWIALVVPAGLVAALWAAPIRWYLTPPEPPVYRWLAQGTTPIVELPMNTIWSEYLYMYRSTTHHRPMINGVNGPESAKEFSSRFAASPIADDFVDVLEKAGVELVVVHGDALSHRADDVRAWLRRELDWGRLTFVREFTGNAGGDWVFSLRRADVPSAGAGADGTSALQAFLRNEPACGGREFVALSSPVFGSRIGGDLIVAGWASSPHGIRHAEIYFNNRTVRHRVTLAPARDRCRTPAFFAVFPDRPENVWEETDVQVEVLTGRGTRLTSENRWFTWK